MKKLLTICIEKNEGENTMKTTNNSTITNLRASLVGGLVLVMALILAFSTVSVGAPTTLTTHMTVDDAFDLYLSTDDTQIGTYIGSGSSWMNTYTFMADLTPGVTNYVHVFGTDRYRVIAAFIGDFSVSDTSFKFLNDSQSLVTDRAHWSISNLGFGQGYYMPDEIGINGSGPWGFRPGISSSASWIWSNYGYDLTYRYFSTSIIPVPAPAALMLALEGLGGLALLRRRRG
jgi:hypothetical protein